MTDEPEIPEPEMIWVADEESSYKSYKTGVYFAKDILPAINLLKKKIAELETELFEMTKLCHEYQNELWTKDKEKLENENRTRD